MLSDLSRRGAFGGERLGTASSEMRFSLKDEYADMRVLDARYNGFGDDLYEYADMHVLDARYSDHDAHVWASMSAGVKEGGDRAVDHVLQFHNST